jgi:hypothetical protein
MTIQQAQARSQTERQVAGITREILAVYDDARKAINTEIGKLYANILAGVAPEDYYNTALKFDRLGKLLKKVDTLYIQESVKAGAMTAEASRLAMQNSYYKNQFVLSWFTPNAGIDLDFTPIPDELVRLSVTGNLAAWQELGTATQNRITKTFGSVNAYTPQAGSLSSLLVNNRRDEVLKINRAISSGLLQGKSFRETARDVSRLIGTVTPKGSTGAKASAIRIVRTESNRTYNAGSFANTQAVVDQGVEVKRVWVATLDGRTRDSHISADGQAVGPDEPFSIAGFSPMFPGDFGDAGNDIQCRCTTIDAVDGIPPQVRRGVDVQATREAQAEARAGGASKSEADRIKITRVFDWKDYPSWASENGLTRKPSGRWS